MKIMRRSEKETTTFCYKVPRLCPLVLLQKKIMKTLRRYGEEASDRSSGIFIFCLTFE
jgi:hypothetical protein